MAAFPEYPHFEVLREAADQALYRAKHAGQLRGATPHDGAARNEAAWMDEDGASPRLPPTLDDVLHQQHKRPPAGGERR